MEGQTPATAPATLLCSRCSRPRTLGLADTAPEGCHPPIASEGLRIRENRAGNAERDSGAHLGVVRGGEHDGRGRGGSEELQPAPGSTVDFLRGAMLVGEHRGRLFPRCDDSRLVSRTIIFPSALCIRIASTGLIDRPPSQKSPRPRIPSCTINTEQAAS